MPVSSEAIRKTITPNLAAVVAAVALLIGVVGLLVIAWFFHADFIAGVNHVANQDREVSYVNSSQRIVRSTNKDKRLVVCPEAVRQLQSITASSGAVENAKQAPPAVLSTIYLREAGWQICNAYANGAIDAAGYAKLLERIVTQSPPAQTTVSGNRKGRSHTKD